MIPQRSPFRGMSPFLSQLTIKHGPRDLLGKFFFAADRAIGDLGISLEFGSFEELLAVNKRNSDTWLPITPTFSSEYWDFSREPGICLLGRDGSGKPVCTYAARKFDWTQSNCRSEIESLQIFYPDPDKQRLSGEEWTASAPMAEDIMGMVSWGGAAWLHPDYRRTGLLANLARLSRAYSFAQWELDFTGAMMSTTNFSRNITAKTGLPNSQPGLTARASPQGDFDLVLLWLSPDQFFVDLAQFLSTDRDRVDMHERRGH